MSPAETSGRPGLLEHPDEAFAWYRDQGLGEVVVEEKHMGSRAVLVVARDEESARRRFGVPGGDGIVYSRGGRRFFDDPKTERAILDRVRAAITPLWHELATDWAVIDAEILPWSLKAQGLLRGQYAPVGTSARSLLGRAVELLERAPPEAAALLDRTRSRAAAATAYDAAWRRYCWEVSSPDDVVVAPFHLLATDGAVHVDRPHSWHMETFARLAIPGVRPTAWRAVELADPGAVAAAISAWEAHCAGGGEGFVVKPADFVARGRRGVLQPAIKVRGHEYLRIIYGPEYDLPGNLDRLRSRSVGGKRALAIREFALGIEGLERFVAREPLRRVHECACGVLALESEPMDPRL
jgi:protein phosphatase